MKLQYSPTTGLPLLRPMLAVPGEAFDSPEYIYEVKWDGIRCLAYLGEGTSLVSRNGNDLSYHYPELMDLHLTFPGRPLILDGELVTFEGGKPSFHRLLSRNRLQNTASIRRAAAESPAVLMVFDILYLKGNSLLEQPLLERKKLLADNLADHPALQLCEYVEGEGRTFFEAVCKLGLEGMIAKHADSRYYPGKRSNFWHKVKGMQEEDLVVCGYTRGKGQRESLGALILGGYRDDVLTYAGVVGSGFSQGETHRLLEQLEPLVTPQPSLENAPVLNQPVWVRPGLVCTVNFLERSPGGDLRHSSFVRLREDKAASECVLN
ncbi:MAG TPA: non-homologous end-joining DNA ligase [Bacillota bacterium]|nr:non-homologous end-joining DNA ligase [Bacillota bacterium]